MQRACTLNIAYLLRPGVIFADDTKMFTGTTTLQVTTTMPRWAQSILDISPEERSEQDCRRLHALLRGMRSFDKFTERIQLSLCRAFTYIRCVTPVAADCSSSVLVLNLYPPPKLYCQHDITLWQYRHWYWSVLVRI